MLVELFEFQNKALGSLRERQVKAQRRYKQDGEKSIIPFTAPTGAGKTIIMISHEIPFVFRLADYTVILNHGEKVFEGTKEELVEREDIFDKINIEFPPVVRLSKELGLDEIVFDVDDFIAKVTES